VDDKLYLPAASTAEGVFSLVVTPESAGWGYSGLRVVTLPSGGAHTFGTKEDEVVVLPLSGSCTVRCSDEVFELEGRRDVFSRITDFAYLPRETEVTVSSGAGGRFGLLSARCGRRLPARYGPASDVPVELRGAGVASRQINLFCTPESFDCDKLIAVEVLTPGGNWSSYPPHKHDEARENEVELEEIYYFEVAGEAGFGYHRVYGTPERPIDVLAEVRTGDVVLIPHGWHGPAIAAPGYDMYYLNVMAGPGQERLWLICDDPAHAWIRSTWPGQPIDPRLPMTSPTPKED
jgi:5-deoxy-glucuronate isomerase